MSTMKKNRKEDDNNASESEEDEEDDSAEDDSAEDDSAEDDDGEDDDAEDGTDTNRKEKKKTTTTSSSSSSNNNSKKKKDRVTAASRSSNTSSSSTSNSVSNSAAASNSAGASASTSSVRSTKGSKDSSSKESKKPRRRNCSFDYRDPHKRSRSRSGDPQIRFKTGFRNTVHDVMKKRGWKHTDSDLDWDIHWADREWMFEHFDHVHLESWQRVNHYRNDRELCRKDLLIKNVKRKKRTLEREKRYEEAANYEFCPTTFVLPGDYALFVEEFKRAPGQAWIMKPTGRAQGRGIFLFTKLKDIAKWKSEHRWKPENNEVETYVVQRYINRPYLVGGKKFDLRLYALVTSFSQLTCYLYRRGFCRFSSTRYTNSTSSGDMSNLYMHLTNVAIQKQGDEYNASTGGKWDLRKLKLYMMSRHGAAAVDKLFYDIQMIILHSLFAVQPVIMNDKHCFELYGYDIMIDEDLRPWLIEVNASPSLSANTKEDYKLKFDMLNDMFDIIDVEKRLSGDEEQVGGFDLIYANGAALSDQQCMYSSFLGCDIPPRRPSGQPQLARRPRGSAARSQNSQGAESKSGTKGANPKRFLRRGSGTGGIVSKKPERPQRNSISGKARPGRSVKRRESVNYSRRNSRRNSNAGDESGEE